MGEISKKRVIVTIAGAAAFAVAVVAICLLCQKGDTQKKHENDVAGGGTQIAGTVQEKDSMMQTDGSKESGGGESAQDKNENSTDGESGGSNQGGSNQGGSNQGGSNQGTSQGGQQGNPAVNLTAQFQQANSWDSEGKKFVQYDLSLTNGGSGNIADWKIKIPKNSGLTVSQLWNCTVSTEGNYVIITPADYNKTIAKGALITGIGLIVSTDSAYAIADYTTEATGASGGIEVAQGNGNGGSGGGGSGGNTSNSNPGNGGTTTAPTTPAKPVTPPAAYGGLHTVGTSLVDAKGNKIQLKGVSTHGLQWFPQYVNKETFQTFRDDWGANAIRLALYVEEGGYLQGDKAKLKQLVFDGVEYATELGMYVIIDWHILNGASRNPLNYTAQAKEFFDEMSKKYDSYNNVIYEICNEPNGAEWNSCIKPYAEQVIATIRQNDNDALILVGTNTWSQDVDAVVGNELSDHNVMYVLHFYAATHQDNIRNKLTYALSKGVPIFVSECSICDASGNGGVDYNSANTWLKLLNDNDISYIAWNISNKGESSALIQNGNNKLSGWSVDELSETGKWFRKAMRGEL